MKQEGRIIGVHLLNDLSGSPLVFSMVLKDYVLQGKTVELFTSGGPGFLSEIKGVGLHEIPYRWNPNKLLTLMNFLYVQVWIFFKLVFFARKNDCVYVNTLLPFGALIAARVRGLHTIQHMHEVSVKPVFLFKFLCFISEHCTRDMIFVSAYLKGCFQFKRPTQRVVHNRLDDDFLAIANQHGKKIAAAPFTVLMLCSLKAYKGVFVFLRLASALPHIQFRMLLNASANEIEEFKLQYSPSANCEIIPPTKNTHPYYQSAHVLVNLSLPDQWIETFGMTLLEARAYGLKIIAPPVGGPAEIVQEPDEGYLIDSRNEVELMEKLNTLYESFCANGATLNSSGNTLKTVLS